MENEPSSLVDMEDDSEPIKMSGQTLQGKFSCKADLFKYITQHMCE